ncbi:hypothetical protein P6F26_05825 [Roseibacterium sp. SDUM158017]|uniref:hypothetical protein n=1 Tax=Roseicyclus salinarum TaxID=3036773 RepID=UPI002415895F|nr:hypothetical protein [Roseibacterium sp. SDUM158017]MDG4647955.1 hypothetical protein [Roseibacterium sp. SDUM158017]
MALGLVLLAGMIAMPLALGAWALGFATFGEAILIYIGSGFSVIIAGVLSAALAHAVSRLQPRSRAPLRVRIDVTLSDR